MVRSLNESRFGWATTFGVGLTICVCGDGCDSGEGWGSGIGCTTPVDDDVWAIAGPPKSADIAMPANNSRGTGIGMSMVTSVRSKRSLDRGALKVVLYCVETAKPSVPQSQLIVKRVCLVGLIYI